MKFSQKTNNNQYIHHTWRGIKNIILYKSIQDVNFELIQSI